MPDFQTNKIWVNFEGYCNEVVGIFYGHLVYFKAI
jgi:hypothetical protein